MRSGAATRQHAVAQPAPTSDLVGHGRGDLPSLTGLRFVAALAVFAFHTAGFGLLATGWWRLTQFGFLGVGFFFVLSGVVLTWSARPRQPAAVFWRRRFARIYPSHVVVAVVAIGLYLWVMPPHKPLWAGLLALLLVQAWAPTQTVQSAANGVSWSLSCEAFFYALFPWVAGALRRRSPRARTCVVAVVLGACAAVAVAASFAVHGRYDVVAYENPLVRVGEFVLGVALGCALRDGWVPRVRVRTAWLFTGLAVATALGVGAVVGWPVPRGLSDVLAVGPLSLLLMAYAGRDLRGSWSVFATRPLVYLGQVSFAFYLVHQVLMDLLLQRLWPMPHATVAAALARAGVALVLAVAAAVAVHHLVELPGQRRLSRPPRSQPPRPVVLGGVVRPVHELRIPAGSR